MRPIAFSLTALLFSTTLLADERVVDLYRIDGSGVGQRIGLVRVQPRDGGIEFMPRLSDLPAGSHGFHVHEKPECESGEKEGKMMAGLAAGGHYDPDQTGQHLGPQGAGHKGDLPMLIVESDGTAVTPVFTRNLSMSDLKGRALMVHAEPDNYGDKPGGARIACGEMK